MLASRSFRSLLVFCSARVDFVRDRFDDKEEKALDLVTGGRNDLLLLLHVLVVVVVESGSCDCRRDRDADDERNGRRF